MNKDRRKDIEAVKARVEELATLRDSIKEDVERIRDDEQDYYENMPDSIRDGERGQNAQEAVYALESVIDTLDFDTDVMTSSLDEAAA